MRKQTGLAILPALTVALGCGTGAGEGPAVLESEDQKASYSVGINMGVALRPVSGRIDMSALLQGIEDSMNEVDPAIPQEEMQAIMAEFSQWAQEEQLRQQQEAAEASLVEAAAFFAENGQKEGMVTTESGLQYEVLREGDGAMPTPEGSITVHYRGTLLDGTQFDSSYDRGEPATFPVGGVIPGFSEGLQLMSVGSHYRLFIPPELGYGPQGFGGGTIPPNAALIFEVELIEIPEA